MIMRLRERERETSGLDDDWRSLEVIVSIRTGSGYPSCALVEFVL
jgi:hypothetical protein